MVFNFDTFVNRPCMRIFGRKAVYMPLEGASFEVTVDFHKAYEKVELEAGNVPITSTEITAFVRDTDCPNPLQGDHVKIENMLYEIIDIKEHIPGSKALILHESLQNDHP